MSVTTPPVRRAVAEAAGDLGGLDIVVNNAGVGAQGTVEDNDDDEWHRVFDVNVVGMVRVTRAALPHLRAPVAAAIVNTCSIAATAGLPQRALYSATKGAVLVADPGDGRRPPAARASGSTASTPAPPTPPGSAGCWTRPPTRRPSGPRWRRGSRRAGWSPRRRSPRPSPTWRARGPGRPPAPRWLWTAACRACGCGPSRRRTCTEAPAELVLKCPQNLYSSARRTCTLFR